MQVLRQSRVASRTANYSKIVFVCIGLATLLATAFVLVALWATSEFTQPEGIVATQIRTFSQEGTLYYSLKQYPYTVCAYMPIFYGLTGLITKAGIPVLLSGRLVSIAALALIFWLVWQLTLLYSGDRLLARLALALAGCTQLLLGWGTTAQVDTLTIAFSLLSFYLYSLNAVAGRPTLDWAALAAIAALFTKQTALAAPATIFVLLLVQQPKRALRFAAIVAGLGGAAVLGLNAALQGRFLENTVFANINPFAWYKLLYPMEYIGIVLAPMILIVLVGVPQCLRTPARALYIYLAFALGVFLLTAPKVGADSNYLVESTILLILCGMCALHHLNFFELLAQGSKSWVTLLVLPLALYGVQNLRVSTSSLTKRIAREQHFTQQVEGLRPYLGGKGRILSTDSNALLQAGRSFEVEPLIYRLLVEAGRIDATPVQKDLDAASFETILLYEDLSRPKDPDPEFPRLTPSQMASIQQQYQLVKQVPGPNLQGVFVYQRRTLTAQRDQ
jgi:hypothetical protein